MAPSRYRAVQMCIWGAAGCTGRISLPAAKEAKGGQDQKGAGENKLLKWAERHAAQTEVVRRFKRGDRDVLWLKLPFLGDLHELTAHGELTGHAGQTGAPWRLQSASLRERESPTSWTFVASAATDVQPQQQRHSAQRTCPIRLSILRGQQRQGTERPPGLSHDEHRPSHATAVLTGSPCEATDGPLKKVKIGLGDLGRLQPSRCGLCPLPSAVCPVPRALSSEP